MEKLIQIIYDARKRKEFKNMIAFCKYHQVKFECIKLKDYVKPLNPPSTGFIIDNTFIPYDYFLKNQNHLKICEMVDELKEESGSFD